MRPQDGDCAASYLQDDIAPPRRSCVNDHGRVRCEERMIRRALVAALLPIIAARLTVVPSGDASFIGCFSQEPTAFFAFHTSSAESAAVLSRLGCSNLCKSQGAPVFGLSSVACACTVDLPDDLQAIRNTSCQLPCPGWLDDSCGSREYHYAYHWVPFRGGGPKEAEQLGREKQEDGDRVGAGWIAGVVVPTVLLVVLAFLGALAWWRRGLPLVRSSPKDRGHVRLPSRDVNDENARLQVAELGEIPRRPDMSMLRGSSVTLYGKEVGLAELAAYERVKAASIRLTPTSSTRDVPPSYLLSEDIAAGSYWSTEGSSRTPRSSTHTLPSTSYHLELPLPFGDASNTSGGDSSDSKPSNPSNKQRSHSSLQRQSPGQSIGKHVQRIVSGSRRLSRGRRELEAGSLPGAPSLRPQRTRRTKGRYGTGEREPFDNTDDIANLVESRHLHDTDTLGFLEVPRSKKSSNQSSSPDHSGTEEGLRLPAGAKPGIHRFSTFSGSANRRDSYFGAATDDGPVLTPLALDPPLSQDSAVQRLTRGRYSVVKEDDDDCGHDGGDEEELDEAGWLRGRRAMTWQAAMDSKGSLPGHVNPRSTLRLVNPDVSRNSSLVEADSSTGVSECSASVSQFVAETEGSASKHRREGAEL